MNTKTNTKLMIKKELKEKSVESFINNLSKNTYNTKEKNNPNTLEIICLKGHNYQDAEVMDFIQLKRKVEQNKNKTYLVIKSFEEKNTEYKKIMNMSKNISENNDNYFFVGVVKEQS